MKNLLMLFLMILGQYVFGQDAKTFYEQAMQKAESGKLEEALELLNKSIDLKNDEYVAWYNRGIVKSMLNLHEEALLDFEQTLLLNPGYKKAYLNRGTAKKRLTDYEGAISDYSFALTLDPSYADAFYNKGLIYEMFGSKDSACYNYEKARELGTIKAQKKLEKCNDPSFQQDKTHGILRLLKTADNKDYGFTSESPVKVGSGWDGGAGNQAAYLNLLRDAMGKPVKYERVGSCCPYKSENGILGIALIDNYEITYFDESGKENKTNVYISFYDYEEPMILNGFKTLVNK